MACDARAGGDGDGDGHDPTDAVDAPGLPSAFFSCLMTLIKRVVGVPGLTAERHGKPGTHTKKDRPHGHRIPSCSLLLSLLGALSGAINFCFAVLSLLDLKRK